MMTMMKLSHATAVSRPSLLSSVVLLFPSSRTVVVGGCPSSSLVARSRRTSSSISISISNSTGTGTGTTISPHPRLLLRKFWGTTTNTNASSSSSSSMKLTPPSSLLPPRPPLLSILLPSRHHHHHHDHHHHNLHHHHHLTVRSFHNSRHSRHSSLSSSSSSSNRNKYVLTDISSTTTGQEGQVRRSKNIDNGDGDGGGGGVGWFLFSYVFLVAGTAGIGHIVLSAASLWWSTRTNSNDDSIGSGSKEEEEKKKQNSEESDTTILEHQQQQPQRQEQCFDAHHYQHVIDFVSQIYDVVGSGGSHDIDDDVDDDDDDEEEEGRNSSSSSSSIIDNNRRSRSDDLHHFDHERIILSPTLVFEDPAAKCVGPDEFKEAFRVLHLYLKPRSIYKPTLVDVRPNGQTIDLYFDMYQQYSIPSFNSTKSSSTTAKTIRLRSTLVVSVQLEQTPASLARGESDFRVVRIEERWNSHPLFTISSGLFSSFTSLRRWQQASSPKPPPPPSSSPPPPPPSQKDHNQSDFGLCSLSRRLNGIISYQLSRRLL